MTDNPKKSTPARLSLREAGGLLSDGLLTNNPAFVQTLGMCPTLATTTSAPNGFAMGVATAIILIFSNLLISLLRRLIPKPIRIAAYVVIIAGFVTALEMLMNAFFPVLDQSLGIYLPLIVVNCIILARAEAFASKNGVIRSMLDGLAMGAGFALALLVIGSVREIFGAGTFFGITVPIWGDAFKPMAMLISPPGAFIVFGILIGVMRAVMNRVRKRRELRDARERVVSE